MSGPTMTMIARSLVSMSEAASSSRRSTIALPSGRPFGTYLNSDFSDVVTRRKMGKSTYLSRGRPSSATPCSLLQTKSGAHASSKSHLCHSLGSIALERRPESSHAVRAFASLSLERTRAPCRRAAVTRFLNRLICVPTA